MKRKKQPEIEMTEDSIQVQETRPQIIEDVSKELEFLQMQVEIEKSKLELEKLREEKRALSSRVIEPFEQEIIERQKLRIHENKAVAEKINKQKEYDNLKVTGKFLNRRAPGQMAKLAYIKYEDDPIKWWEMYDGKVYTIPRGFADQINDYYHTPQFIQKHGPIEDEDNPGSQIDAVDRSNKKYAFVPIGFENDRVSY